MSLKSTLNQIIKDRNGEIVTLQEIEAYCHKAHYKLSNAERRLRASESPNIERVMKNGAIIGYRYLESGPDVKQWFKPQKSEPQYNFNGELISKRAEINRQILLKNN